MNDADSAQVYLELQNWVENFTELSSLEGMNDTILVQLWSMGFRSLEEIADTDRNAFLAEVASFNALRTEDGVRADHLTTLREAGLKTVDDLRVPPSSGSQAFWMMLVEVVSAMQSVFRQKAVR